MLPLLILHTTYISVWNFRETYEMEITKGRLKEIIKEEVNRMSSGQDATKGREMAEQLINEFKTLSANDRQVFLTNFIQFLNKEKA